MPLRKNLCKFNNSDKKRYCERLEKQLLNFFTVYNKYRNLSSFFNSHCKHHKGITIRRSFCWFP